MTCFRTGNGLVVVGIGKPGVNFQSLSVISNGLIIETLLAMGVPSIAVSLGDNLVTGTIKLFLAHIPKKNSTSL